MLKEIRGNKIQLRSIRLTIGSTQRFITEEEKNHFTFCFVIKSIS